MTRRGIHTKPNRGRTVQWLTPPEIVRALGPFDFDPCAHPRQFYRTAKRMISPPQDGLSVAWKGRVWLNPPYGARVLSKWIRRLAEHGNGNALVPSRTEVEEWFWPYIWESADALLFLRGRIHFYRPNGKRAKGNAGHGSVIAAYGAKSVAALLSCGLAGRFIDLGAAAQLDCSRISEWMSQHPRRRPDQAFTAGAERHVADWIATVN